LKYEHTLFYVLSWIAKKPYPDKEFRYARKEPFELDMIYQGSRFLRPQILNLEILFRIHSSTSLQHIELGRD